MSKIEETWEEKQARLAREKARRKQQEELEETALIAYMAGGVGNGYAMYAAAEMTA